MKEELICTICPLGCVLDVEFDSKRIIKVAGNRCKRGIEYAEREVFHPERVLTTTVLIRDGEIPLLPVKTSKSIARDLIADLMKEIAGIRVEAPVKGGDCIREKIGRTDADLIATRSVAKKRPADEAGLDPD